MPEITLLTPRFIDALVYAAQLHASQFRKDRRVPYIAHLLSVTALVLEDGGDEDEAIAALLHDAVEDQGGATTREEIRLRFGDRVTAIVDGCTEIVEPATPLSWEKRKQHYIEQLRYASLSIRRVSLADKLHNARSLLASLHKEGEQVWTRFFSGKEKTLWFYRSLLNIYLIQGSDYMTDELEQVLLEIEQLPIKPHEAQDEKMWE